MSSSRLNEINSKTSTLNINNIDSGNVTLVKGGGNIGIGGNPGTALLEIHGTVNNTDTTDASSSSVGGASTIAGGLAVGKKLFVGNNTSISGTLDMNSNKILNLLDPSTGTDAANKNYIDNTISELSSKTPVRAATTVAGTLASSFVNGSIIDDVTLVTGYRILIKDQTVGSENGIYTVNTVGAPTRAPDFADGSRQGSSYCLISQGTDNGDSFIMCTNDPNADLVGTDSLVFAKISGGSGGVVPDPVIFSDAANKNYVDNTVLGLPAKTSVRVATTVSGTLASSFANASVVDGIILVTGYRILIKNQSSGVENGIYTVNASGAPTRASDFDTASSQASSYCLVQQGTVNGDTFQMCSNNTGTAIVGTNALTFAQISGGGTAPTGTATAYSTDDIPNPVLFALLNNNGTPINVTGFTFPNSMSFIAQVFIRISATTALNQQSEIRGTKTVGGWVITESYVGDNTGITFTITSLGQIQYTSPSFTGFTAGNSTFRASCIGVTDALPVVPGSGTTLDDIYVPITFTGANNTAVADNVTSFTFANSTTFTAQVHVKVVATTSLFAQVELKGVYNTVGSAWYMTENYINDDTGVRFSITSLGQIKYTSLNYTGFSSLTIKFRALTTGL